jgi:hypothetical protein
MTQEESFEIVQSVLDTNFKFLEKVLSVDIASLHPDSKDLLLSQLKKTIGKIANVILNDNKGIPPTMEKRSRP